MTGDAIEESIQFYDRLWSATTRVDQHHKCRLRAIEKAVRGLPAPDGRPRRILELGCGSGIVSERLSRYGAVVGIDQSPEGVEAARARGCGRFEIGVLPGASVPGADFDLCVLSQVIEHFDGADQVALLHRAWSLVRPGGHLILTTPNRPVSEKMRFARGELQPIENWLDPEQLRSLLERNGWRVLHVSFAFSLFPVLMSRFPWLRPVRFFLYDLVRLRDPIESLAERHAIGDCTVVVAVKH